MFVAGRSLDVNRRRHYRTADGCMQVVGTYITDITESHQNK